MKRIISFALSFALLFTSCMGQCAFAAENSEATGDVEFKSMSDPALLSYLESEVYDQLVDEIGQDGYFIENVSAVYISQEYLEELAYNSQSNIYFGYTLAELDEAFQGTRYVFTLDEDGTTGVKEFEAIQDDTFNQVLKNVAIGTGVILICVTVSVATGGAAPAVSADEDAKNIVFPSGKKLSVIEAEMKTLNQDYSHESEYNLFASAAVGIIHGGETVYTGYFGEMNRQQEIAVDETSVFEWCSVQIFRLFALFDGYIIRFYLLFFFLTFHFLSLYLLFFYRIHFANFYFLFSFYICCFGNCLLFRHNF